jgi:hypothetical protein
MNLRFNTQPPEKGFEKIAIWSQVLSYVEISWRAKKEKKLKSMKWAAQSLDLSSTEKVLEKLVRQVGE